MRKQGLLPEGWGRMLLLVLLGAVALVLGIRVPSPSLWIVGVGMAAVIAMLMLRRFGVGRVIQLVAAVTILAAGIGGPLLAAGDNPDLQTENMMWTSDQVSGPDIHVSGHSLYAHNIRGISVIDRASGKEMWTFDEQNTGERQALFLRVSSLGEVLFMYVDGAMVYTSLNGEELWRMSGDDDFTIRKLPLAMANGTVAIRECPASPSGDGIAEPCRFYGRQSGGSVAWERAGYQWPGESMKDRLEDSLDLTTFCDDLPPWILLRESEADDAPIIVVDAETGDELDQLENVDLVFPAGDLILTSTRNTGTETCTLRGTRPGETMWEMPEMPCITDPWVVGTRLYAATQDGTSAVTVNLEGGCWRDLGTVNLMRTPVIQMLPPSDPVTIPMEHTIVTLDGHDLRSEDAATGDELWGRELWTYDAHSPWEISVGHDTIAVTSRFEPGLNPFVPAAQRDLGLLIVAYDAVSGEEVGKLSTSQDEVSQLISFEGGPVFTAAPGEVYVMRDDWTIQRLGRP